MKNMVSIVMPAYNAERFFSRSIQSVLNQTYTNWELIVVNDESLDNTLMSACKYALKDKRIRVATIKHGGVSCARNAGFRLARGEYLQFMDADDELDKYFVEKMVNMIEKNDADMAVCRFTHPFFQCYVDDNVYDMTNKEQFLTLYQECFGLVMPWNRIWKRKCFTNGYDTEVKFSEDELGNLANLPNVKKVVTTSEYLYYYHISTKENNEEEDSCINTFLNEENFWDKKVSMYYMGAMLLPKRKAIIERAMKNKQFPIDSLDDMAYYRLVDYFFVTLAPYIGMGTPEYGMVKECQGVVRDERFIKGFQVQERYGFKLIDFSGEKLDELCKKYINLCYKAYNEHGKQQDLAIPYVFTMLFLKLFTKEIGVLDTLNLNAKLILDMQNNSTKEAIYANGLLSL